MTKIYKRQNENEYELIVLYDEDLPLRQLVEKHKDNLCYADLRNVDFGTPIEKGLPGIDLSWANLSFAGLRGANLQSANLMGANLHYADLRGANFDHSSLGYANLNKVSLGHTSLFSASMSHASLIDSSLVYSDLTSALLANANLTRADLQGADLSKANLVQANLTGTNLYGTNISSAYLPDFQIPQDGSLIVWKSLSNGVFAKLKISASTKRTASLISRKCRAESARVIDFYDANKRKLDNVTSVSSTRNPDFYYHLGQVVVADSYDDDIRVECTHGIHFFQTFEEAKKYLQ